MAFEQEAAELLRRLPPIDREYLETAFHNYYVDYGAPSETLADLFDQAEEAGEVLGLLEESRRILVLAAQTDRGAVFWELAVEVSCNSSLVTYRVFIGHHRLCSYYHYYYYVRVRVNGFGAGLTAPEGARSFLRPPLYPASSRYCG